MKDFEFALEDQDIGQHKWYGKETQTEDSSIHDVGKGEGIVIRQFEFQFPPTLKDIPSKEALLTPQYLKDLQTQLWADGLRLVLEPRLSVTKERCIVFATCQATSGNSFLEEPKLLQEWIH